MLYSICIGLILVASILLILAVLVQSPKSGMAANFGAANQVMGAVRRYIYPQGGKRIALNIFGFRLSLPECIYLLLRDWVKPILKR